MTGRLGELPYVGSVINKKAVVLFLGVVELHEQI